MLVTYALLTLPEAGAATIDGYAPTVDVAYTFVLTATDLTVAGTAPTVIEQGPGDATLLPEVGAASLTGYEPTILVSVSATPEVGAASVEGFAPTASVGSVLGQTAGSAAIAGNGPTVRIEKATNAGGSLLLWSLNLDANLRSLPTVGALALTGHAPTVTVPVIVEPGAASLSVAALAPYVEDSGGNLKDEPAAASLGIEGQVPTVTGTTVSGNQPSGLHAAYCDGGTATGGTDVPDDTTGCGDIDD